ncbi:pyrroline-5-carboxylate reductase [Comamonas sp. NLF-1-9]|uniref:pyrroline-5-carboxylate reductase n=1 Tax=Comamonas sp. NLF-1-9 TaxID=2853163 RepID=UPI001C43E2A1|nr:pyrroline-5-carboxylate reductase [Comamonas sp. NLF-1-9]QXL83669.1 pyrroline-5-carboxylate reductase [Comamonas sp. NLF-1-9]
MTSTQAPLIACIGGGNMASAILGGLLGQGLAAEQVTVVEPSEAARAALHQRYGLQSAPDALAVAPALAHADLVLWAVKPQVFRAAAEPVAPHVGAALHLSVAAGIPTDSIARWLGTGRIVRAMPNTPALIGQGISGLFARPEVSEADKALIERVMASTGQSLWVHSEAQLDAVTALSGSGPAYVFFFLEAMMQAGQEMGLSAAHCRQLALATFGGATELARRADESPAELRARVTSAGGTTHAAITHLQQQRVDAHFIAALKAAQARAGELAAEFGKD